MRRILKWTAIGIGALLGLVLVSVAILFLWLRASLPQLDGELRVAGLAEVAEVLRDAEGVPTVVASGALDAARATGFLHGQDRFFQMDLLRRRSAGELAELLGPAVLGERRYLGGRPFRRKCPGFSPVLLAGKVVGFAVARRR